jgi:hypothetical protein
MITNALNLCEDVINILKCQEIAGHISLTNNIQAERKQHHGNS